MAMMIVAAIVIVAFAFLMLFTLVSLAILPGQIAKSRGHPQAEAISIAGSLGLIAGIPWLIALVWAYYRPDDSETNRKGSQSAAKENLE